MKKFSLVMVLFLLSFITPAFSEVFSHPVEIEQIADKLPELESVSCKFKQERYFKNIAKPLISGGDFRYEKNKGVFFDTTYPIQSSVNYTNRDYRQINEIVKSISNKKYSKLEKDFDFYYENQKNKGWNLGLKPKKGANSEKYISSISFSGTDYIKQIVIILNNGNKTILWFTK